MLVDKVWTAGLYFLTKEKDDNDKKLLADFISWLDKNHWFVDNDGTRGISLDEFLNSRKEGK